MQGGGGQVAPGRVDMSMTHTPGPWPAMKERRSCAVCQHYNLRFPCRWYGHCKGIGSTSYFVYSLLVAAATAGRNAKRERHDR